MRVRQVASSWLERKAADCTPATLAAYARAVDKISDRLGHVVVGDLTVAMIDEFERELLQLGAVGGGALSARSVLGVHAVLHQILDDAVRRGLVPANTAASAAPPRHHDDVVAVWSLDEVRAFLAAAGAHRLFAVFAVVLATGLTRGEVVGLRWGDVDLDAGEIEVRRIVSMTNGRRTETEPSASARRTVSIGDRTVEVLQARRVDAGDVDLGEPVFEQRGGGELNPESLSLTLRRLVDRAGVPPLTMSGLRHTHAAMAVRAGVDPLVVSRRLGHASFATTYDMYGHLIPALRDPNLDLLEQAVLGSGR